MTALILLSKFRETEIEIWRPVQGTVGYDVSSLGRIRSYRGTSRDETNGRLVSVWLNSPQLLTLNGRTEKGNKGYVKISYQAGLGRRRIRTSTVHSLVAKAFLPECPADCNQVNHKNGIKVDNRAENLEWSNASKNQEHANTYLVKRGEQLPHAKITEEQAAQVKQLRRNGWRLGKIASFLDVSRSIVEEISAGNNWRHVT